MTKHLRKFQEENNRPIDGSTADHYLIMLLAGAVLADLDVLERLVAELKQELEKRKSEALL